MKPYGVKRNWNAIEDWTRNGHGERVDTHRKNLKMTHRWARRKMKTLLKKMF